MPLFYQFKFSSLYQTTRAKRLLCSSNAIKSRRTPTPKVSLHPHPHIITGLPTYNYAFQGSTMSSDGRSVKRDLSQPGLKTRAASRDSSNASSSAGLTTQTHISHRILTPNWQKNQQPVSDTPTEEVKPINIDATGAHPSRNLVLIQVAEESVEDVFNTGKFTFNVYFIYTEPPLPHDTNVTPWTADIDGWDFSQPPIHFTRSIPTGQHKQLTMDSHQ